MKNKLSFLAVLKAGGLAAVASAVINAALYYLFHATGLIRDDIMIQPGLPLTVIPVLISSVLPSLVAVLIYYLFERFTRRGYLLFSVVSLVLLAVSFLNPFLLIPGVTTGYALALNLMHIVVAAAVLYFIRRELRKI